MSQQVQTMAPADAATLPTASRRRLVQAMHIRNRIALGMLWAITAIVALIFIVIIVYLIAKGFTALFDPTFYSTGDAGIAPELFNTFYMLILSELFLFPIALAAAIYLIEYAPQGRLVTIIHFAAETLAGVPSIVLGLFGFIVFGSYLGFHFSRIAGALTLLCLNLPIALRLFEDALAAVPRELREGSLALGATKWQAIRSVILPSALPGIVTGLILSAGKIIGEAAALIFNRRVQPAQRLHAQPVDRQRYAHRSSLVYLNRRGRLYQPDGATGKHCLSRLGDAADPDSPRHQPGCARHRSSHYTSCDCRVNTGSV